MSIHRYIDIHVYLKLQMEAYLVEIIKPSCKKEQVEQFNEFQEQDHINVIFLQNSKLKYFYIITLFMQRALLYP